MIKPFHATVGVALAAAALFALPAGAQTTNSSAASADSLNQLLQYVQTKTNGEMALFEKRARTFNSASEEEQQAMLKKALAKRAVLQETADKLSDTYSKNEIKIQNTTEALNKKASELGLSALFGLAKQAAGQVVQVLNQSLIATQFETPVGEPTRTEFLTTLANEETLPTVSQLERLWFEIQREMTAQGQVVRYTAPVVQPNGVSVKSDVIRIGPFTATSNGKYLKYLPRVGVLSVLPKQLPAEFMSVLQNFQQATSGYVPATVDSSRGVLTQMYIERPSWIQRIEQGESIGYLIIAIGIAGALLFFFQLIRLIFIKMAVGKQLKDLDDPANNNPLGRVLLAFKGDTSTIEQDSDVAELRLSEAVMREIPRLEAFQAFLRLAVASGPLLGLIGTVVGMIITFQSITETGSSDPQLMANGIGQAMIATVLGLSIAIPLLFGNALLNSMSRKIVQTLDEQSAGILAESIERKQHAS